MSEIRVNFSGLVQHEKALLQAAAMPCMPAVRRDPCSTLTAVRDGAEAVRLAGCGSEQYRACLRQAARRLQKMGGAFYRAQGAE